MKVFMTILIILSLSVISISFYTYFVLDNVIEKTYEPIERITTEEDIDNYIIEIKERETYSGNARIEVKTYLILGIDNLKNDFDKGRTDSIILAIVNDYTGKITLLSIPRDTYVEIAGKEYKDKINHAYQYGLETTIATVENFTGIQIDNYVTFNFVSFVRIINALGGITINVDENVARYSEIELGPNKRMVAGENLLSGEQALYFSRFRHDNNGDFGRNKRQQQVIEAIIDQSKSIMTFTKVNDLLEIIGEDIRTDLTKKEIYNLTINLLSYSSEDIERISYEANSERFGEQNLWYVVISEEERERVSNLLMESVKIIYK